MAKVEAVSSTINMLQKSNPARISQSQETGSFQDALKKLKQGELKMSEKQTSILGIIGITFAANVMLFGEKLGLQKLGPLAPVIGAFAMLSGALGLLFCAGALFPKTGKDFTKTYSKSPTSKDKEKDDIISDAYKDLGIQLTHH